MIHYNYHERQLENVQLKRTSNRNSSWFTLPNIYDFIQVSLREFFWCLYSNPHKAWEAALFYVLWGTTLSSSVPPDTACSCAPLFLKYGKFAPHLQNFCIQPCILYCISVLYNCTLRWCLKIYKAKAKLSWLVKHSQVFYKAWNFRENRFILIIICLQFFFVVEIIIKLFVVYHNYISYLCIIFVLIVEKFLSNKSNFVYNTCS